MRRDLCQRVSFVACVVLPDRDRFARLYSSAVLAGAPVQRGDEFQFTTGGPLGNGRQWMPWIHVADLARLYLHAADTAAVSGPMNSVAPNPVRNAEFTKALARQLHRPAFLSFPYYCRFFTCS